MADGVFGQRVPQSGNSLYNALAFFWKQMASRMNVATMVEVVAVHTTGEADPVGTVDVRPLVDQQDGAGNPTEHTTVFGLPYMRMQGGSSAVIVDPQPGDVGFCVFADRDTSRVRATGTHALPGSFRRFDLADGFYLGGWNPFVGAPTSYVLVQGSSVKIVNASEIDLTAPVVKVDGDLQVTGAVSADGDVVAMASGSAHHLSTHVHGGVQTGGGNTGGPVG